MRYCKFGDSYTYDPQGLFTHFAANAPLLLVKGAGIYGNNTAQMVARLSDIDPTADVTSVMETTNDAVQVVPVSTHANNMRTIIDYILGLKQDPVMVSGPPGQSAYSSLVEQYRLADFVVAAEKRVAIYDPWSTLVDGSTGQFKTEYGGAVVHPNSAGYRDAGLALAAQYKEMRPMMMLPHKNNTSVGLNPTNACLLTDTDANGLADSWSISGSGSASALYSLVPGAGAVVGNWQRINAAAVTGAVNVAWQTAKTTGFVAGDKLLAVCRLKIDAATNVKVSAWVQTNAAVRTYLVQDLQSTISDTVLAIEFVVPAGVTSWTMTISLATATTGAYTADVSFAQAQVYNLTTATA